MSGYQLGTNQRQDERMDALESSRLPIVIPLWESTLNSGESTVPTTEVAEFAPPPSGTYSKFYRVADLTHATEVRLVVTTAYSIPGVGSAEARIQFSDDDGATWHYGDNISGPSVDLVPGGVPDGGQAIGRALVGEWVTLAGVAQGDVLCRVVTAAGDGTEEFDIVSIHLHAR